MKSNIIKLTICAVLGIFGISALAPAPAFALDDVCSSGASAEVKRAAGCPGFGSSGNLSTTVQNILNAIIGVAGLVAAVFIVVGGVNYMTSAGDAGKLKKAKDTILYACIGLVVCALAFAIVNWTIGIINRSGAGAYTDPTSCVNAGYTWDSGTCK